MAEGKTSSNTTLHIIYIVIILVLLGGIGFEYHYYHAKMATMTTSMAGEKKPMGGKAGMKMPEAKAPTVSDQQTAQLKAGTDTSTTQKTFNITGGNFYFVPKAITVNKGDQVTFVFTNAGGFHDLEIDELGVKTPVIQTGNAATATFTASKTGSFVYYCGVPGHRQKGMWGTLTVQ